MIIISHPTKKQFDRLLANLVAVYQSAYEALPQYAYRDVEEIREYLNWLNDGDPQGFFVANDDHRAVAFASVHGSWQDRQGNLLAEIHELVVRKEYQGKGIGGRMMHLALDYATSLGRRQVGLWVGEHNERAETIYAKMGFVTVSQWGIWKRMRLDLPAIDESQ